MAGSPVDGLSTDSTSLVVWNAGHEGRIRVPPSVYRQRLPTSSHRSGQDYSMGRPSKWDQPLLAVNGSKTKRKREGKGKGREQECNNEPVMKCNCQRRMEDKDMGGRREGEQR